MYDDDQTRAGVAARLLENLANDVIADSRATERLKSQARAYLVEARIIRDAQDKANARQRRRVEHALKEVAGR